MAMAMAMMARLGTARLGTARLGTARLGRLPMVLALAGALVAGGCATTEDGQATQAGGMALGAILGAGLGALTGDPEMMALGAAIGAGAGLAAGTAVAQQKQQYANAEAFYDAEIEQTRAYNVQLDRYVARLRSRNQEYAATLAELENQQRAGQLDRSRATRTAREVASLQEAAERRLADAREELAFQREVLADARASNNPAEARQLQRQVAVLEQQVEQLEQQVSVTARSRSTFRQF